ncbi:MAG TPA: SulP family inorganic anion transporter [Planctomicrobium sp.]|nr:SulP family inorganic anion transporter [Planctomicrobium sp.]
MNPHPAPSDSPRKESKSFSSGKKGGGTFSRDFAASIVVFLVALPLCMGISIASGVPIAAGLVTGIVAGIVVGFLAGCPLQVSGPAAGLTVIVYEVVQTHGLKMLGLIVLLAGILQLVAGLMRFGQWFRAVSPAVVHGMLAGIGILIFASQFHVMLDDSPSGKGIKNILNIPGAISKLVHVPQLPEKGLRGEVQSILKELGELHRQQVELSTFVDEKIPNHHVKLQPELTPSLTEFSERQAKILDQLKAVQTRGLELFKEQPSKQDKVRVLGNMALENQEVSLQALNENRTDLVTAAQLKAATSLTNFQSAFKNNEFAAMLGVLTIFLMVTWKAWTRGPLKQIPAPLVGIVVATCIAAYWQLPVLYVEIPTAILEDLHFVNLVTFQAADWTGVLVSAFVIAIIASAETLLCATAVDSLHTGPRTNYDKELRSQGIGNMICGFMGALPMTGVIVRSSANVQAGAATRMSAIMHGVWFLVFVLFMASLLRMIPTSALAAILVLTGYKLVDRSAVKQLAKYGWSEVFIWAATVIVIVVEDLLLGVLTGLALAMLKLVLQFSALKIAVDRSQGAGRTVVRLEGNASFLRLPKLARSLESLPAGSHVILDTTKLSYLDQACLELMQQWREQYVAGGGTVDVDWSALEAFARAGNTRSLMSSDQTQAA